MCRVYTVCRVCAVSRVYSTVKGGSYRIASLLCACMVFCFLVLLDVISSVQHTMRESVVLWKGTCAHQDGPF